jgi:glycosyltransferase 2 family protein
VRSWIAVTLTGLVLLGATWILAAGQTVPGWEQTVFETVNGLPRALHPALWLVMQLGSLAGACLLAPVMYVATRQWRSAAAVVVAALAAWTLAKVVKNVVGRGRPAAFFGDVVFPGDAEGGFGFVSGHTAVAFAVATVIAPYVPRRWRVLPFAVAGVVGFARMYVGVHLPLDVLGGAGLGLAIGGLVNLVLGSGRDQSAVASPTGQATPVPPSPQ